MAAIDAFSATSHRNLGPELAKGPEFGDGLEEPATDRFMKSDLLDGCVDVHPGSRHRAHIFHSSPHGIGQLLDRAGAGLVIHRRGDPYGCDVGVSLACPGSQIDHLLDGRVQRQRQGAMEYQNAERIGAETARDFSCVHTLFGPLSRQHGRRQQKGGTGIHRHRTNVQCDVFQRLFDIAPMVNHDPFTTAQTCRTSIVGV
jgi:hypothetical protein